AESRAPVQMSVVGRLAQCEASQRAGSGRSDWVLTREVQVGNDPVDFSRSVGVLEAKSDVQRQIPGNFPVVLGEVIVVPDAMAAHRTAEILRVACWSSGRESGPIGERVEP